MVRAFPVRTIFFYPHGVALPTKYETKTVLLDADASTASQAQVIVPRGIPFRSFLLLSLSGATDFNLQIGTDQNPLPFVVPGMVFSNDSACDYENDGLFGTWQPQPGGVAEVLIVYQGGAFRANQ
jgi:hypothetical protein